MTSALRHFATIRVDDADRLLPGAVFTLKSGDSTRAALMLDSATREVRFLAPGATGQKARDLLTLPGHSQRQRTALAPARGDTASAYALTLMLPEIGPLLTDDSPESVHFVATGHVELRFVALPDGVLTWVNAGAAPHASLREVRRDALTAMHGELARGVSVAEALQRAGLRVLGGTTRESARFATVGAFRVATGAGRAARRFVDPGYSLVT